MMIKVLFDDAFFSLSNSGIASYWSQLLRSCRENALFEKNDIDFKVVNRSDTLRDSFSELIDFPKLDINRLSTDLEMLGKLSDHVNPDLFISSYYTFVPGRKSLGVFYDLIPEVLDFETSEDFWQHRRQYINQVASNIAISNATLRDLLEFYPFKKSQMNWVIKPGVNLSHFRRSTENEIGEFRKKYQLGEESFVVFLGSRHQKNDYKNSRRFFEEISFQKRFPHNVVCVGGESLTEFEIKSCQDAKIRLFHLELEGKELPICLSSAVCLVYPSLYEGFGMPVVESLAVGTPVVTGSGGGLLESGGILANRTSVESGIDIVRGIDAACELHNSLLVKNQGPLWAASFSWHESANLFVRSIIESHLLEVTPRVARVNDILRLHHQKMKYLE